MREVQLVVVVRWRMAGIWGVVMQRKTLRWARIAFVKHKSFVAGMVLTVVTLSWLHEGVWCSVGLFAPMDRLKLSGGNISC